MSTDAWRSSPPSQARAGVRRDRRLRRLGFRSASRSPTTRSTNQVEAIDQERENVASPTAPRRPARRRGSRRQRHPRDAPPTSSDRGGPEAAARRRRRAGAEPDAANLIWPRTNAHIADSVPLPRVGGRVSRERDEHVDDRGDHRGLLGCGRASARGGGVSIGVSLARDVIAGARPARPTSINSDQVLTTSLVPGTRVQIAHGPDRGNIFEYVGPTISGVDLAAQNYGDTARGTTISAPAAARPSRTATGRRPSRAARRSG